MTKSKEINKNTIIQDFIISTNYEGLEYISWFMTDSQNVQNWVGNIFRGGFNINDPRLVDLLTAANKAILEVEDDIAKIKDYLSKIIPLNNN